MGGLTMPDFMFRNLSVKLYPAVSGTAGFGVGQPAYPPGCSPFQTQCGCTAYLTWTGMGCLATCHATITDLTGQLMCNPPTFVCAPDSKVGAYVDPESRVVIPPGADPREELELLKSTLQRSMSAVDARLAEVKKAAQPTSVGQIDALKSHLLAAVDELDQQRAQLEDGGQAPSQG
jgi:hypothetical protein